MALIPYPEVDTLPSGTRHILKVTPRNIARMMAGLGALFEPLMDFALSFLKRGTLSATLREAVTYRFSLRYGASYVLDQHALMARGVGLTTAQLSALQGDLPSPEFSAHENAALLFADAQIDSVSPSEELLLRAYQLLGETAFHELLLVAGFYHLAVRYSETIRIGTDGSLNGNALHHLEILCPDNS